MMTKFTRQDLRELLVTHAEEHELDTPLLLNLSITSEDDGDGYWHVHIWAWDTEIGMTSLSTEAKERGSLTDAWDTAANQFVNLVPRKKSL